MVKDKLNPLLTYGVVADTPSPDKKHKKRNRKRDDPDPDLPSTREARDSGLDEDRDGVLVDDAPNEPTMGDKLAKLNSQKGDQISTHESGRASARNDEKPPTAASLNVLLRQALHADDPSLLFDCLYNQDEQVIANSVAKLNSSDVLKFLNSLLPIIQSRGAILACTIPRIMSLLLNHSSGIMLQESSLFALNSFYQILDDLSEEEDDGPVIYEDKHSDDEEEEDGMETDEEADENGDEASNGVNGFEVFEDMSN